MKNNFLLIKTKIQTKNQCVRVFLTTMLFLALFSFSKGVVGAEIFDCGDYLKSGQSPIVDCGRLSGKDKDECEIKDRKRKLYCNLIEIKSKQANTLQNQLSVVDKEINKLDTEIVSKKNEINDFNDHVIRLSAQVSEKEKIIEDQKKILSKILQSYYEHANQDALLALFSNYSLASLFIKEDRVQQLGEKVSQLLESVQLTKENFENEKKILEERKSNVIDLLNQLQEKNSQIESHRQQKQSILSKTKGEEAIYKNRLEKIEEERRQIEEEIEMIELHKIGQIDYSKLPPIKKGYFTYPVNPADITQGYGKTSFAKTSGFYKNNFHNGVDFGIKTGNNIFAARSGKVIATGDNKKYAYGKWMAVEHGDGLTTLYGHLSGYAVSKGASVKEGQKIAYSGNTGFSTGPHLHFSVFSSATFDIIESKNVKGIMIPTGASLNPMRYLK